MDASSEDFSRRYLAEQLLANLHLEDEYFNVLEKQTVALTELVKMSKDRRDRDIQFLLSYLFL